MDIGDGVRRVFVGQLAHATDGFSDALKLGGGGFGSVYKAALLTGGAGTVVGTAYGTVKSVGHGRRGRCTSRHTPAGIHDPKDLQHFGCTSVTILQTKRYFRYFRYSGTSASHHRGPLTSEQVCVPQIWVWRAACGRVRST